MKTFTVTTLAAALAAAPGALAFAPQASSSFTSTPSSALFSTMPPRSELKGYYTSLTERNEEYEQNTESKMVASEMGSVWDPLGLSENLNGMFFMRESEIKHCRLAMLVSYYRLPLISRITTVHVM